MEVSQSFLPMKTLDLTFLLQQYCYKLTPIKI